MNDKVKVAIVAYALGLVSGALFLLTHITA